MKKALMILAFAGLLMACKAQTVQTDAKGNYVAVKRAVETDTVAKSTGKTYTDTKGKVYEVYQSKNGKLFVRRTSAKTGKIYNQYLKITQ